MAGLLSIDFIRVEQLANMMRKKLQRFIYLRSKTGEVKKKTPLSAIDFKLNERLYLNRFLREKG